MHLEDDGVEGADLYNLGKLQSTKTSLDFTRITGRAFSQNGGLDTHNGCPLLMGGRDQGKGDACSNRVLNHIWLIRFGRRITRLYDEGIPAKHME